MSTITSRTRTLSNAEQGVLENSLRIASLGLEDSVRIFRETAERIRGGEEIPMFAKGKDGIRAAESMVAQFQGQLDDTLALYERVQESETIALTMPEED